MKGVVEFLNGDVDCVHFTKRGYYEICIVKCGEMGMYKFKTFDEVTNFLTKEFYLTNEMIEELKTKTTVWDK